MISSLPMNGNIRSALRGSFSISKRMVARLSASPFAAAASSKVKPMPRTTDPWNAFLELATKGAGEVSRSPSTRYAEIRRTCRPSNTGESSLPFVKCTMETTTAASPGHFKRRVARTIAPPCDKIVVNPSTRVSPWPTVLVAISPNTPLARSNPNPRGKNEQPDQHSWCLQGEAPPAKGCTIRLSLLRYFCPAGMVGSR